jgi:hypothetical protein
MSIPSDVLVKRSAQPEVQTESIYDLKNAADKAAADKTAAADAATWQQRCDSAMQSGFAHMMSLMGNRERMVAAIRGSMISR